MRSNLPSLQYVIVYMILKTRVVVKWVCNLYPSEVYPLKDKVFLTTIFTFTYSFSLLTAMKRDTIVSYMHEAECHVVF